MKLKSASRLLVATALATLSAHAGEASISIDTTRTGHKVSPLLWGIFFEDINLSADGGLYPELVRNRSFEGRDELQFWNLVSRSDSKPGQSSLDATRPLNAYNRNSLLVKPGGGCVLENPGYWGMNFVAGDAYHFQIAARAGDGFGGTLTVQLCDASGEVIGSGEISGIGTQWDFHSLTLKPSKSDPAGKLRILIPEGGEVSLDMISLMPAKTWKGHGLRSDLAESMDALKPAFFRFPGGCWVEGDDMAHAYRWKETIGDVASRTPLYNVWDYTATHGIGYHEYLQLSEDLGAEPLFCINVGMSHTESIPMGRMGEWVQDSLDAIEYANGPVDSVWGSLRAKNGHPEPFNLRYVEIGNENGGANYAERWPLFVKAIKDRYPEIILIANFWEGSYPKDPMPEIVDEHYYETPETFMRKASQYDSYDRNGPKIFVGEYAATKRAGQGNLRSAIGEAAFMTGLERNSDVVAMAAYAPLFTNVNHRAWNPDLINFDSSNWYGIPSYHVQRLFSLNTGDVTLPIDVRCEEIPQPEPRGMVGLGTWNSHAEFKDLKVTAPDGTVLVGPGATHGTDGWTLVGDGEWSAGDGVLRQSVEKPRIRALMGDKSWKDYTIELKARKISGREGFVVLFHNQDLEGRTSWNIGGWDNRYSGLGLGDMDERKDFSVETGRWYDVKVELEGNRVRCSIDGEVIHDFTRPALTTRTIYASATRDSASGDLLLKVVNTAADATETTIDLKGLATSAARATATVLTSTDPLDENSLEEPDKVSPKKETFAVSGASFARTLPGNSLTVIRIPAGKH
ncbi:MAG: DUF1080 domain-containing protein [Akkermansiaceae bacterium]|nr:DUF1080 domain-containing protein [Akkermansiaceae bacterium]MCP5547177.1 DUF1080 domain-containing protein [Akkermansiaceae bacterium]